MFVTEGATVSISSGTWSGGTVTAGLGGTLPAPGAFGSGLFIQGDTTVALAPSGGETLTIGDDIADQTGSGGGGTYFSGGPNCGPVNNPPCAGYNGAATGTLLLNGAGTVTLGGANTYTGTTTVASGTLIVTGSIGNSSTTVQSGATAMGTGAYGPLTVESGGTFAPGLSPGAVATANLTLESGATFVAELDGLTPGLFDVANVAGTVDVTGATLDVTVGFSPGIGDSFVIIDNDGADAVTGSFAGLPEGTTFQTSGMHLSISYVGGDGNDIELTVEDLVPVELTSFEVE